MLDNIENTTKQLQVESIVKVHIYNKWDFYSSFQDMPFFYVYVYTPYKVYYTYEPGKLTKRYIKESTYRIVSKYEIEPDDYQSIHYELVSIKHQLKSKLNLDIDISPIYDCFSQLLLQRRPDCELQYKIIKNIELEDIDAK